MIHMWRALGSKPEGERLARVQQSPNHRNGVFRNALTNREDIAAALGQMMRGGAQRSPAEPLTVVRRTREDYAKPPVDGLRVTWFGHSSILIEIDGKRILTDPVWGPRTSPSPFFGPKRFHPMPLALEELPPLDAVLISHDHYDHLDFPTIQQLAGTDVPFYVPLGVGAHLAYWGIEEHRIIEMDWWQEATLDQVRLVFTPARHFSGRGLKRDRTLWGSWSLVGPQHRVFFSGDSGMFPGFSEIGERLGPFDITLMESGAYNGAWPDVHMGPEQAVQAHRMVRGKLLIPVHWGTFSLAAHAWTEPAERILVAAEKKGVRVFIPRQGERVLPGQVPAQQRWWPDIAWQTADQAPVLSTALPEALRGELASDLPVAAPSK
ncbi:MBL fold metallo-hydrolase [Acanthopleuribacter pedis]|uniref:MBL fold metallo-hydrolase n=1 Tax=Acanthopleuribacter pedis TaxID=442870 RepID=A0A8J7U329_9BACT|nr:MBL fold metallo-hydrolase [Acanthopleuribacter pedis]MBO1318359.1 MBL fold metallo-hydrolase [Acanthopleuribacter pedis]